MIKVNGGRREFRNYSSTRESWRFAKSIRIDNVCGSSVHPFVGCLIMEYDLDNSASLHIFSAFESEI